MSKAPVETYTLKQTHEGKWTVTFKDKLLGEYATEAEAETVIARHANPKTVKFDAQGARIG